MKNTDKVVVVFHLAKSRTSHNKNISYKGELDTKAVYAMLADRLYLKNRDKNGRFIPPVLVADSDHEVISMEEVNRGVGVSNFDHDYDSYVVKNVEDCSEQELYYILTSSEYRSETLVRYLEQLEQDRCRVSKSCQQ